MLISQAWAQGGGGGGDIFQVMMPLVLIFAVFYFLLIRPQQKKAKEHRSMLDAVQRGDKVVTGGGIIGTIAKVVSDEEVQVEIAENIRIRVARSTLASIQSKTKPAGGDTEKQAAQSSAQSVPTAGEAKPVGLVDRLLGKRS